MIGADNRMKSKCIIDNKGRECSKCHQFKPWIEFRKGTGPHKKDSACKKCYQIWRPGGRTLSSLRVDEKGRTCFRCKVYKPWSEFNKDLSRPHGHHVYCKLCHSKNRFKRSYGITSDDYEKLNNLQNGVCAICGKKETVMGTGGKVKPLSVDHDHITNTVRGLLCFRCNTAIGSMDDDIGRLSKAIKYLSGDEL